ncbi:MAG: CvpA family protein [Verrucomicrobia bacterium]|nr:CvpA family protein [Verrucomicrobiota bacterium]
MNLASSIYGVCLLILLWYVINGWSKGPARMLIKVFALAAGYVAALLLGESVAVLLKPLGYPQLVLLFVARALVALTAYLLAVLCGAILFKRTAQQEVGIVRFFYGVTGAGIGLVFGLVLIWIFVVAVRVAGTLAPPPGTTLAPSTQESRLGQVRGQMLGALRAWKSELEDGPLNGVVKAADPLREQDYETADRLGVMLTDPARVRRFWESPAMREWAGDTKARELTNDPEIQRLGREGDFDALLRHPKVVAYLDDPDLLARVRRTDLAAALRDAVPEPRKAR